MQLTPKFCYQRASSIATHSQYYCIHVGKVSLALYITLNIFDNRPTHSKQKLM